MKPALITAFVTALTCLCLSACGSEESTSTTTESNSAPAAQAGGGGGGGGGGSACARARDCCSAYVDLVGAGVAAQACSGIDAAEQAGGPTADMSCNGMISGWRTAFTSMSRDVPAACQ